MKKTVGTFIVLFATILVIGGAWAQPLPTAKPEQVGMSSERLARLGPAMKAQITNDRFPGAVPPPTCVGSNPVWPAAQRWHSNLSFPCCSSL